jgi:SAM-dependent methyltransferase
MTDKTAGTVRSYSSGSVSALAFVREACSLYRYSQKSSERARACIDDMRRREALVAEHLGLELRDLDILEIGPGQFQGQTTYLAVHNRVVGIDLDVIAQGFQPLAYLKMLRSNGLRRTTKTVARKLLGVDRKFAQELARQLSIRRLPKPNVIQMDATSMSFPDRSFDFVYARSVFHHLPDPGAALDGVVRVLKPGGAAYILLHLYTSETGCLDPRIYTKRRDEIRGWLHLRPGLQAALNNQNTYVNKLRLHEWRRLFDAKMPSAKCLATRSDDASLESAKLLQSQGELLDYSLEELTTNDFAVLWRKPADPSPEPSAEAREDKQVASFSV